MKASAFSSFGPPDVLALVDVRTPEPRAGEIRVLVRTAGVRPADAAVRAGWRPPGAAIAFPQVPGDEFAGTVDRVGRGVRGFAPGDDVLGFRTLGCHAEYVVVPAVQLERRPAGMSWDQAGALPASGQAAHTALGDLDVGAGETVLVHGAAGGVGGIAVQLALDRGATVIGTASEANHAYLRSLGAVPTAYGDGLTERVRALAPRGVDAVLDAAGRGAVEASLDLVADRGRIGTLVDPCACRHGVRLLRPRRTPARLSELVELHARGRLRVHVRAHYPLYRAAEAHREVETGHGRGRIVLRIG